MAYGQTGSGKSFTMQEDPEHIGIIPRAIVHVFEGNTVDIKVKKDSAMIIKTLLK